MAIQAALSNTCFLAASSDQTLSDLQTHDLHELIIESAKYIEKGKLAIL